MIEQTPEKSTEPTISIATKTTPATEAKPPRPKKWRRRFRTLFLTLAILFVAFRVALQFMLPTVLRRTAKLYGLAANYERHEMDLFGGDVGIWHLTLAPADGGEQLMSVDYCRGDVSTWDLLRGRLVVRRLEAEGIDLTVERDAKGEIPLLKRFAANPGISVVKPATKPIGAPTEIDLTSPLQLDAFRMDRVHAHIIDRSVSPPLDTRVDLNLRLTDLRSPTRQSTFDLDVSASPLLDSFRARGQGKASGKHLDAMMNIVVSGLHPGIVAGYLVPFGIKPLASSMGMMFDCTVATGPCTQPGALAISARLDEIKITADEQPVAALQKIAIDVAAISPTFAEVTRIAIDGGLAVAERSKAGALRIAGMELGTATTKSTREPTDFALNIARVDIRAIKARFSDSAVKPTADLGVQLEKLTLKNLSTDPAKSNKPVELSATLLAPGIARSIRLDGAATIGGTQQSADFTLRMEGVKPDALKPYLDTADVDCLLNDAAISCEVHAATKPDGIEARLQDVKYTDGHDLLTFNDVHINGLKTGDRLHIDSIDIAGPSFNARHTATGALEALGFRTRPPVKTIEDALPGEVKSTKAATTTSSTASSALPKIDIGRLTWKGVRVTYEDLAVSPVASIRMEDAGIELNNIRFDADAHNPSPTPAKIRAWLKVPGLAGDVRLEGTVISGTDLSTLELEITGEGLTTDSIGMYLKDAGIEPTLRNGSLRAHVKAELKSTANGSGMELSTLSLKDVQLKDTAGELLGLDALHVDGLKLRGSSTEVKAIQIDKPRVHVTREKDGTFTSAGFHTLPATTKPPATGSVLSLGTSTTQSTIQPKSVPATIPSPVIMVLNALKLKDAELRWTDLAATAPVDLKVNVSTDVDDFVFGRPADAAKVNLTLKIDGVLDELKIGGQFSPSIDAPTAHLDIDGKGIRLGQLAAYIPPTITSNLKDGRLKLTLDAGVAVNAKGGQQGHVIITAMDLRDGAEGPPLLRFDSAAVKLDRYDPNAKIVALEEISLSGLEADIKQSPDGMSLLGMRIVTAAGPEKGVVKPGVATAVIVIAEPSTKPVGVANAGTVAASATGADVARAVAANRLDLPLVTLEKLDIGVRRVTFTDTARPNATPLEIKQLELKSRHRIEMLGSDTENRPPIDIELTFQPLPLAESFKISAKIAPFAERPSLALDVAATGVNGKKLLTAFPELAPKIDGDQLTDGRLTMQLKTELKIDRRDLLRLDFSRPFDADFSLNNLEFRNAGGPLLIGLKEFRTDAVHIDPRTGGVRAKSVEISNFSGTIVREKDGIHVMGLILRGPTTQTALVPATTQNAPQPTTSVAVARSQSPTQSPTTKPAGEIRIDALLISGMDLRMEDRSVSPPLIVPISAFDLEARDLSNYLMYDADKSTRFSLLINSGKVPLAAKKNKDGTGGSEERELFSQITASGKMSLYPEPRGWVKAALSGLEIASLQGEARAAGFDASGGTFDADIDARFLESGVLDLRPKFVFVDLGIKDSQDSGISHFIGIPISLDKGIIAVQDVAGQISIPLHVTIEKGKVDTGSVIGSVAGAVGGVIMTAALNAPVKVVAGVASMIGFDLTKKKPLPGPVDITFDAASALPERADGGLKKELIDRLRDDKTLQVTIRHDMSAGDVQRAAGRANPSGDDTWALAYQLRLRRSELLKERAQIAGQARGELGSGQDSAATLDRLRGIGRELAATEDGLDDLNELVRPGAGRQALRRTRAACLAIGEQRLIAIRDMLLATGIPNIASRINIARASFEPNENTDGGKVNLTFKVADKRQ